jgi:dimethylargininase
MGQDDGLPRFAPPGVRALVRRPARRLAEGLLTHIERQPIDVALAGEQWASYVEALRSNGWEPVEVPADDDLPDSVFVEDTIVVFADLAVITRPGAVTRRAETAAVEATIAALGYELVHVRAPGTLDGGDVLKVGSTVYVGLGGRTNAAGAEQLSMHLATRGATVVTMPCTKVLHLKSAVTALPDGTVVGWLPAVEDAARFPRFVAVPEESGAHVVHLGGDRVLMAADAPKSAAMFTAMGYRPVEVDISEFQKLEGCVTCLSIRLRGEP